MARVTVRCPYLGYGDSEVRLEGPNCSQIVSYPIHHPWHVGGAPSDQDVADEGLLLLRGVQGEYVLQGVAQAPLLPSHQTRLEHNLPGPDLGWGRDNLVISTASIWGTFVISGPPLNVRDTQQKKLNK